MIFWDEPKDVYRLICTYWMIGVKHGVYGGIRCEHTRDEISLT
jgi:hypothetical protein